MPTDGSDERPALPGSVGGRPGKRGRGEHEAALEGPNAPPDESAEGGDDETRGGDEQQSVPVKSAVEGSEPQPGSARRQVLEVLLNEEEESRAAGDERPEAAELSVIAGRRSMITRGSLAFRPSLSESRRRPERDLETLDVSERAPHGRADEDGDDGHEERPVGVRRERPRGLASPS